jgi:hypothetical protein
MEKIVKAKSILEGFVQNIVIFYLTLIFLGGLGIYCYYDIFNIPVFDYYNVDDIINVFFKNFIFTILFIIVLLGTSTLFTAITYFILKNKKVKEIDEKEIGKRRKWKILIAFLLFIVTIIMEIIYLIEYFKTHSMNSLLGSTAAIGAIILAGFNYITLIFNDRKITNIDSKKRVIIFIGIMFGFWNYWFYYAQGIMLYKSDHNKQKMTFNFNNGNKIVTSDSLLFLGKSKDYLFFFNKPDKESKIYDRTLIESIVLENSKEEIIKK